MGNEYTIIKASYVDSFKCIGGDCSDSCCIGWNIDIDKVSFRKYFKTTNLELKKQFSKHLKLNNYCQAQNIDYGYVSIDKRKWCPFLDQNKLCKIYTALGKDSLSNVCHTYPRVYNILNGVYEISMYMSCPEVIQKILTNKEPLSFIKEKGVLERHIVHNSINTTDKVWKNSPVKNLKELRENSIKIIQDRSSNLDNRLIKLGLYLVNKTNSEPIKVKNKYDFVVSFFQDAIEELNVFSEIDSLEFKSFTNLLNIGLKLNEPISLSEKVKLYQEVKSSLVDPFLKENEYLLENYLANFMFQSNFPFNVNQDPFDGYIIIVVRYSFIKFYLSGIAIKNNKITINDIVIMVQVHTKTVSHHSTFLPSLLETIKAKQFNNMDFIRLLLD